ANSVTPRRSGARAASSTTTLSNPLLTGNGRSVAVAASVTRTTGRARSSTNHGALKSVGRSWFAARTERSSSDADPRDHVSGACRPSGRAADRRTDPRTVDPSRRGPGGRIRVVAARREARTPLRPVGLRGRLPSRARGHNTDDRAGADAQLPQP